MPYYWYSYILLLFYSILFLSTHGKGDVNINRFRWSSTVSDTPPTSALCVQGRPSMTYSVHKMEHN